MVLELSRKGISKDKISNYINREKLVYRILFWVMYKQNNQYDTDISKEWHMTDGPKKCTKDDNTKLMHTFPHTYIVSVLSINFLPLFGTKFSHTLNVSSSSSEMKSLLLLWLRTYDWFDHLTGLHKFLSLLGLYVKPCGCFCFNAFLSFCRSLP